MQSTELWSDIYNHSYLRARRSAKVPRYLFTPTTKLKIREERLQKLCAKTVSVSAERKPLTPLKKRKHLIISAPNNPLHSSVCYYILYL